jgi:hypothetical protein
MGTRNDPDGRADFVARLQKEEDRQDLAAHEHSVAEDAQRLPEERRRVELEQSQNDRDALRHAVALAGQAAEGWRAARPNCGG